MKSYKKITALLTCSLSLILMTGCGNNTPSTSEPSSEETSSETQSSSSWSSGEETDSETSAEGDGSSTTDEGEDVSSSSDAGLESSEEEPVHEHTLAYHAPVPATCTQDGTLEYWECTGCGLYFADENAETELTSIVDPATGHDWDTENIEWTWDGYESATATINCLNGSHPQTLDAEISYELTTSATCEDEGLGTYTATVNFEGTVYTDVKTDVVSAIGHDWDTENIEWTWDGYESATATFTCKNDSDHTIEETASIFSEITTSATCEGAGLRTYTASVTFGGNEYTDVKTEAISATGHDWDYDGISWEWDGYASATATVTCKNDPDHTLVETASITSETTVSATCEEEGTRTYTATVNFGGNEYTDVKTEEIAATGHSWDTENIEWTWYGYDSATATLKCLNDPTHIREKVASISSSFTTEPTCEGEGLITYTAMVDFDDKIYTDVKTEVVSATGHDWDPDSIVWTWNGYESATATFTCRNDPDHTIEETASIFSEITTSATCEGEGERVYIASVTFDGNDYFDLNPEEIPATGHDWDTDSIVWTWNGYESATATLTCLNDSSHTKTIEATITSEITEEPTCEGEGIMTYTASITLDGKTYTSTEIDGILATGHTYGDDGYCTKCGARKPTDGLAYTYSDNAYSVSGIGDATDTDIYVPETYDDGEHGILPVTGIGASAFENNTAITSVTLPDSVVTVNDYAFYGCTSLVSASIGSDCTTLGKYVFQNCSVLETVTMGNNVTSIGTKAFYTCSSLENITLSTSLTSLGTYAFYECTSLTSIDLPDSLTSISNSTFYGCSNLASVTLGSGVTQIGKSAFSGCSALKDINIPDTLTTLSEYAFESCASLTSIVLPDGVKTINTSTFKGCSNLANVTLGSKVTSIGVGAFTDCTSLESIVIPSTVTTINTSFNGTTSMKYIYYAGSEYTLEYEFPYGTVYCYSESEPAETGNWWHYVDGVPTVW